MSDEATFERDGVVALRGVVDGNWIERLRAAVERDIDAPGPFHHGYETESGRFHGNLRTWEGDADLRAFCFESGLPALAARLLGAHRVNLFYDQIFVKEPNTDERTRWHNDQPYWPVRGWQILSFWVALDPVTRDSGAVEYIRGSHRWDRWFQPEPFGKTSAVAAYERNPRFEDVPDIEAARGDYDIVSFDLEPGDVAAFHGLTVHGAAGNTRSDRRRRGYAVRYTGHDARYCGEPGSNANLRNPDLRDGDPLDSAQYPVVWSGGSLPAG